MLWVRHCCLRMRTLACANKALASAQPSCWMGSPCSRRSGWLKKAQPKRATSCQERLVFATPTGLAMQDVDTMIGMIIANLWITMGLVGHDTRLELQGTRKAPSPGHFREERNPHQFKLNPSSCPLTTTTTPSILRRCCGNMVNGYLYQRRRSRPCYHPRRFLSGCLCYSRCGCCDVVVALTVLISRRDFDE